MDTVIDDFDDAPHAVVVAAARKPNSIDQINNIKKMIESLTDEMRRLERKIPLDSLHVVKDMLIKRFGRLPIKGDYIMMAKKPGHYEKPLVQVHNPNVDFHEEPETDDPTDPDPDFDPYWGMAAHITVREINPLLTLDHNKNWTTSFGLDHLQMKKEYKLLTKKEVKELPRLVTLEFWSSPRHYEYDKKTGKNLTTITKITRIAKSSAEALKIKAEMEEELHKMFKEAPKWKGRHPTEKQDTKKLSTTMFSYDPEDKSPSDYRHKHDIGSVEIEFCFLKKLYEGRKVTVKPYSN